MLGQGHVLHKNAIVSGTGRRTGEGIRRGRKTGKESASGAETGRGSVTATATENDSPGETGQGVEVREGGQGIEGHSAIHT